MTRAKTTNAEVIDIKTKKTKNMTPPVTGGPSRTETPQTFWAYLAGLIDGDGTIVWTVTPRRNKKGELRFQRTARVSLTMCDLDILEDVKATSRLGYINLERKAGVSKSTKNVYRWQVGARKDIRMLLDKIMPFLRERKCAKGFEMLGILEHWDLLTAEADARKRKHS